MNQTKVKKANKKTLDEAIEHATATKDYKLEAEPIVITIPVERYEQLAKAELILKSYQVGKTITFPEFMDVQTFNSCVMYLNHQEKIMQEKRLDVPKELEIKGYEGRTSLTEIEEHCENWNEFYYWLSKKGYHVYQNNNIFRNSKFITYFDDMEDSDSGEIEKTINAIMENDLNNFIKIS